MKITINIPEDLYKRAMIRSVVNGQTLKQVELTSLAMELETPDGSSSGISRWVDRKLLPEYATAMRDRAFSDGTESATLIFQEPNVR